MLTSSMIARFAVLPTLSLGVFRGEVHQLNERASNVYGNVADELCILVREHNAGRIPPLRICSTSRLSFILHSPHLLSLL